MATINFRVDDTLKEEASQLYKELGLDMTTAIKMFLTKSVQTKSIPFSVSLCDYDDNGVLISDERINEATNYLREHSASKGRKGTLSELFDEEW